MEIAGIPESVADGELEISVIHILHQIGMTHIKNYHIVACHRLGKKDRYGNRNTIIRFLNRKDLISCMQRRKNLIQCREIGFYHLFMMENLCMSNRFIFEKLCELKNNGQIKRVWSFNGTVQFKYTDSQTEKSTKIYHECDLNYYFE